MEATINSCANIAPSLDLPWGIYGLLIGGCSEQGVLCVLSCLSRLLPHLVVCMIVYCRCTYCCPETSHGKITRHIILDIVLWHFAIRVHKCELSYMCPGHDIKLHPHRVKLYRIGCVAWSKPEGLEVRLPIRPAMKSEATNEKNRYSLKRVPNYF